MESANLQIAIGHSGEKVYIYFTEAVGQMEFSPEEAENIAQLLLKHAASAKHQES